MRLFLLTVLLFIGFYIRAQDLSSISELEVSRIEKTLAADDMQGRQVFTPGIEKAAIFITKEFREAGLKPLPGSSDFNQHFTMVNPVSTEITGSLDGSPIDPGKIVAFSADTSLTITAKDRYQKIIIKNQKDFSAVVFKYFESDENVIVLVDTAFATRFARLAAFRMPQFKGGGNRIFILTEKDPQQYDIHINQKTRQQNLTNLVGMIPGKTKPDEYVIFSAHYDHLGIGKPNAAGDSIFNGANDDASGTTAVITLARYFSNIHNNERTLIFAAFTAEEIGEFGSAYFSKHLDPEKVVAMFNIEMIGTESKWGNNSAYITGFDKTDMGTILQKNLVNTPFKFYPDPYPEQQLFLRSDNATLAKLGVPAHTLSTSKMDSEKYYHQLGDAFETLDMKNMTEIIRSIALSAGSIISGKETPQRVKP
jgi:Zn-dependent M28 family amino/carboxypeptidase